MSPPDNFPLQEVLPNGLVEAEAPPALALLSAAVDQLEFGIIITDYDREVLFANLPGRNALANDRLAVAIGENGRVTLRTEAAKAQLNGALSNASRGRWTFISVTGVDGDVEVQISPIANGGVLWIIGNPRGNSSLALENFAHEKGLTVAETNVLRGIAMGLSAKEVAARNMVAAGTVRSQLSSIRDKTGTRSLGELVQRLATLSPNPYLFYEGSNRAPRKLLSTREAVADFGSSPRRGGATPVVDTPTLTRQDSEDQAFDGAVESLTRDIMSTRETMQSAVSRLESRILADPMKAFLESSYAQ